MLDLPQLRNSFAGQCAALFLGALFAGPCLALTCAELGSLAASATVWRELGQSEADSVAAVPFILAAGLKDGQLVTHAEIGAAIGLVRLVYRSRMTPSAAQAVVLRACVDGRMV